MSFDTISVELVKYGAEDIPSSSLYRKLSELCEESVLAYTGRHYFLNPVWHSQFLQYLAQLSGPEHTEALIGSLLKDLQEGEFRDFTAPSLSRLDTLWNALLFAIAMHSQRASWYGYNSHPWFALGSTETEFALYASMAHEGVSSSIIYGNDSELDRYGANLLDADVLNSYIRFVPELPNNGYALWSNGRYTIECVLPENITLSFHSLFLDTRDYTAFSKSSFDDIFHMKQQCQLRVAFAPLRAAAALDLLQSQI